MGFFLTYCETKLGKPLRYSFAEDKYKVAQAFFIQRSLAISPHAGTQTTGLYHSFVAILAKETHADHELVSSNVSQGLIIPNFSFS